MSSSSQMLMTIASAISSLIGLGLQIFLLVVIGGAVRRNRPDAWGGLFGWAIGGLAISIVSPVVYPMISFIASRSSSGFDLVFQFQAVYTLLMAVVHVVLTIVLGRALVRLAMPPAPVVAGQAGVYR